MRMNDSYIIDVPLSKSLRGIQKILTGVRILLYVSEDSTTRPLNCFGSPEEAVIHLLFWSCAVQGIVWDLLDGKDQRWPSSGRASLKAMNPRSCPLRWGCAHFFCKERFIQQASWGDRGHRQATLRQESERSLFSLWSGLAQSSRMLHAGIAFEFLKTF